jgi:putative two-component system response regulator
MIGHDVPAILEERARMLAHILIVEDHPAFADALAQLVEDSGYQHTMAHTIQRARRLIKRQAPDLILLDIHLPDGNGIVLCNELKLNPQTRLIPIIIVTASEDRSNQLYAIEAGADGYVQKPVDDQELTTRLRALLRAKQLNDQLEPVENVIFALARTVEAKDEYTVGHIERLSRYASAIGERLGLGDTDLTALRYGALLHDVGKIGIDETIIRKPGPLTAEEYAIMQKHPLIGERIVAPLRLAARVSPIVRSHHERWDGNGYPDGLAGENIPLGARVVAVIDAYDAMTTQRPYNRVLSSIQAIQQLRMAAGTIWDPLVVEAFAGWIDAKGA